MAKPLADDDSQAEEARFERTVKRLLAMPPDPRQGKAKAALLERNERDKPKQ
jgi:hypothetical protein